MDMQTAFNKAYLGVFKQGGPSYNYNKGLCRYRCQVAGKVRKCAVGYLIPRSQYSPDMEDNSIKALVSRNMVPPALAHLSTSFLGDLQEAHDNLVYQRETVSARTWRIRWKESAAHVARKYKLTVPC